MNVLQEIKNALLLPFTSGDIVVLGTAVLLLGLLALLNIILGGTLASLTKTWDTKTFFKGFLKAFIAGLGIVVFGYVLEAFVGILPLAGMELPSEMITFIEVVATVVVAFKKYAKGAYDKILVILDITKQEVDEQLDEINGVVEEEVKEYDTVEGEG